MSETMTARPETLPGFDYSVLDEETAYQLQAITQCVVELHQSFAFGMAQQVGKAHDLLCGGGACPTVGQARRNNQYSEATFTAWCEYIGVSRSSAYNLLKAYRMICDATPEQRTHLMDVPARLLYAGGSPDAPAELVEGIKNGDITTLKEYRELESRLKAEQARADSLSAELTDRDEQITQLTDAALQSERTLKIVRDIKDAALVQAKQSQEKAAQAADEARRIRADLVLADRKAEGYKQQVAQLDQEAEELQDALDERTEEVRQLKAAMSAAPVPPAVVDETEVQRRVQEGIAAALEQHRAEAVRAEQTSGTVEYIQTVHQTVNGMLDRLGELLADRQLTPITAATLAELAQMLLFWADQFDLGEEE